MQHTKKQRLNSTKGIQPHFYLLPISQSLLGRLYYHYTVQDGFSEGVDCFRSTY